MRLIEVAMIGTDVGFVAYWTVTALHLLPADLLFADYDDPRVSAWNWSFLPIDLAVSATGLASIWLLHRGDRSWYPLMFVSLSLTSASGLLAVSYWGFRAEFDPAWWGPNLFLLLYPVAALGWLATTPARMPVT